MKQKILMLLAVVLLSSASAFAQSGNSEPLKGDVNGDGVVDVADIAAIIDIMANGGGTGEQTRYYYSAGTEEVTASNYTTANNAQSVTSLDDIPNTLDISSIIRKKVYIVLPNGCTPIAKTSANIAIEFYTQEVNGHTIYTSATNIGSGSTCTISKTTQYYYSVGTTAVDASNYTTANNAQSVTSLDDIVNAGTLKGTTNR